MNVTQQFQLTNIPQRFVELNRALTWSETIDTWEPAAQGMIEFLEQLAVLIGSGKLESWPRLEQARIFGILMTVLAEAGQYRHEAVLRTKQPFRALVESQLLPLMGSVRARAVDVTKTYLRQDAFGPLRSDIDQEIVTLLEGVTWKESPDRFMPFRVARVGDIVERLYSFRVRTNDSFLVGDAIDAGLLFHIYQFK